LLNIGTVSASGAGFVSCSIVSSERVGTAARSGVVRNELERTVIVHKYIKV